MQLPTTEIRQPSSPRGRAARALAERGALLLDVRSADEFACDHVAGAVNIPLGELSLRRDEIGHRERPVVVYCRSGRRSAEAAAWLRSQGFSHVHDMGSMLEWSAVSSTHDATSRS